MGISIAGLTLDLEAVWIASFDEASAARWAVLQGDARPHAPRRRPPCHLYAREFSPGLREDFDRCEQQHGRAILVTGDSHGIDLFEAISYGTSRPFVVGIARGYCRPHRPLSSQPPQDCHYDELERFAGERSGSLSTIVYTQSPDRLIPIPMADASIEDVDRVAVAQVLTYLQRIAEGSGLPVVVVGPMPLLRADPTELDPRLPLAPQLGLLEEINPALTGEIDSLLRIESARHGLGYVSKIAATGIELPRDLMVDGEFTYGDSRHWSQAGQRYFGGSIVRALSRLGHRDFTW